jgi:hypothetical protein
MKLLPKIVTVSSLIFLSMGWSFPAQAGRYIFNQNYDTIIHHFGYPQEQVWGWNSAVYTYQTPELQELFPQYPHLKFSVFFYENKVTSVTLTFDENDFTDAIYEEGYNYDQEMAFKFFNYLFGYESTTFTELSSTFTGNETIYDYEYCLGDGVANNFTRWGYAQMTDYVIWHYDARCE